MKKYACQLFTAQTGESSARLEDENGNTIHLHSLVDPRLESRYFQDLNIWGDRIILLGTGLVIMFLSYCTESLLIAKS